MKKTILSIAVLLASMAGITASAQSQNANPQAKTECATGNCTKKDAPKYNPFQGLNLTEQQQTQLKALKAEKGGKCATGDQNANCTKGSKDKKTSSSSHRLKSRHSASSLQSSASRTAATILRKLRPSSPPNSMSSSSRTATSIRA